MDALKAFGGKYREAVRKGFRNRLGGEARLYCYSEARAKKEQGIANRFAARFEGEMQKLYHGLKRPRTRKRLDHVWQRIGRIPDRRKSDIRASA